MKDVIAGVFSLLKVGFEKIPFLDKIAGYRSVLGLVGLAVVFILEKVGVGSVEVLDALELGFLGFTGLALNAKDNE